VASPRLASPRHDFYSDPTTLLVHLDHDARHSLRVSADRRDLLIGHRFRFLAEQLPTARDRDRLRDVLRTFDELHGYSCVAFVLLWSALERADVMPAR
jgi:hypothetical protein